MHGPVFSLSFLSRMHGRGRHVQLARWATIEHHTKNNHHRAFQAIDANRGVPGLGSRISSVVAARITFRPRSSHFRQQRLLSRHPQSSTRNAASSGASGHDSVPCSPCWRFRYPAEHMYAVVANVNDYVNFVPWCEGSRTIRDEGPKPCAARLRCAV